MEAKLKDLIEIPEIELVVNIDDVDTKADQLYSTFVLTDEIKVGLEIIIEKIKRLEGTGVFVKGNFGSGKSHFLSYLYLYILRKNILPDVNVIKILLTKYPSTRTLEEILLENFHVREKVLNRDTIYKKIVSTPTVIIIDELSEFLRSKPTPASFYEDIRFLQYLGEFSFNNPLWVIASLQEWIEETGHISSSIFNRIKDRYPVKINLTSSHIEDIIDKRIIIKKEGAEKFIEKAYKKFKLYFPNFKLNYEKFKKTYPLHPITVKYLSGLTQIFSQHRGVIHFLVNEVKRDLDKPYDYLITPDRIYDNFEDRIKEIPEFAPFVTNVFEYYKQNIANIIKNEKLVDTAFSVIKLLILTEISPIEKRKNYIELAEILLKRFSTFNENINYEFIRDGILEPLVSNRMFVKKQKDVYFIEHSAKEALKIKADIKKKSEKFENRQFLFKTILENLKYPFLPLSRFIEGGKARFIWQNSMREIVVFPVFYPIKKHELERYLNYVSKHIDGYLFVLSPFMDSSWVDSLKDIFNSEFTKLLLFWKLKAFTEDEINFLSQYFSKINLKNKYNELKDEIKKEETEFKDIITTKFFHGTIFSLDKSININLNDIGILPFEKLLKSIFERSLNEIHPRHCEIMPLIDYISKSQFETLFSSFITKGKITYEEAEKKGISNVIESFLSPLNVVKKRTEGYFIKIDIDSELISNLLNIINHEKEFYSIKIILKKGKWGLSDEQIFILTAILIVSGYVISYNEYNEIIELKKFSDINLIKYLKIGKTISHKYLPIIKYGEFIWGKIEDVPTFSTQKQMWNKLTAFIREYRKKIKEILTLKIRFEHYVIFKKIRFDSALVNNLNLLLNSIKISSHPSEGLEKFLEYLNDNKDLKDNIAYIDRLWNFLKNEFSQLNRIYLYITSDDLYLNDELKQLKKELIDEIENYLEYFEDVSSVITTWDEFFEKYTKFYLESHEEYYAADIFYLKQEIEQMEEYNVLKKISYFLPNLTFKYDYFEINSIIQKLPEKCKEDIYSTIFSSPVCSCGFVPGMEPPIIRDDIKGMITQGIRNFLHKINTPEIRQKVETFLFGTSDMREEIEKVVFLENIDELNISLILPYLNTDVLKALSNALKGKWKIKRLDLDKILRDIKGKRFKYEEMKEFFNKILGEDRETIFWITDSTEDLIYLKEDLAKYGVSGQKLTNKLYMFDNIEEMIENNIENLNLSQFEVSDLIDFLKREKYSAIKRHLRNEIIKRMLAESFQTSHYEEKFDDVIFDVIDFFKKINSYSKTTGIEIFTHIIAPCNLILEKLKYKNQTEDLFDNNYLKQMEKDFSNIKLNDFEGALTIEACTNLMDTYTFIFDGLRYDLWLLLKDTLLQKGFKVQENVLKIDFYTDTYTFRDKLKNKNILKWGEHITGKRNLKNIDKNCIISFNFIDEKIHGSCIDLYPLFLVIEEYFKKGIVPIIENFSSFYIISDHGFNDTKNMKKRYTHGGNSIWETLVPFIKVNL